MKDDIEALATELLKKQREKLALEVKELERPSWKRRNFWISGGAVVVALIGLLIQTKEALTAKQEATDAKLEAVDAKQSVTVALLEEGRAKEAAETARKAKEEAENAEQQALGSLETAKKGQEKAVQAAKDARDELKEARAQKEAEIAKRGELNKLNRALEEEIQNHLGKLDTLRMNLSRIENEVDDISGASPAQAERLKDVSKSISEAKQALPNPALLDCAVLGDSDHFIAVGLGGVLIRTNDGGESWIASNREGWRRAIGVCASADGRHVFVSGISVDKEVAVLITSDDAGESWQPGNLGEPPLSGLNYELKLACSAEGRRVWAVGYNDDTGFTAYSDSYGVQWKVIQSPSYLSRPRAVHLSKDGGTVWIGGEEWLQGADDRLAVVARTFDDGKAWHKTVIGRSFERNNQYTGVEELAGNADDTVQWAFEDFMQDGEVRSRFHQTTDRGATWENVSGPPPGSMFNFRQLFVASDERYLFALTYSELYQMVVHDRYWQKLDLPENARGFFGLDGTRNGRVLWVVGRTGLILKSTNGGQDWERIPYPN